MKPKKDVQNHLPGAGPGRRSMVIDDLTGTEGVGRIGELLRPFARVGIVGVPPLAVIAALHENKTLILDLDEPHVPLDMEETEPYLPRVYCAILRTVVLNALHLDLDAVVLDVGPGKCDGALHVATILEEYFSVPIVRTRNQDRQGVGTPISRSRLPLVEKVSRITAGVREIGAVGEELAACLPTAGFWGVPPRDFAILEPFPDTTHVYGWTRCMENKTPADAELEASFNPDIPTIFFAQSFCAKTALARMLARKHPHGLYLDADVHCSSSARAKIQAFLELSGVGR